jgi:SAM-dependent methyltransferase
VDKKDYFSQQSAAYAAFRPTYPPALYESILRHVKGRSCAWDCGTGNGQVARHLAAHFESVYATDISPQQLMHAYRAKNIFYSQVPAEKTEFPDQQFDLITVAQALHWFDLPQFYREVRRTARTGGLLAVWGYGLLTIDGAADNVFRDFYHKKIASYWDPARKLVDTHYRDIPFPFETIESPDFFIQEDWTIERFAGYISSWSATQKYIQVHGETPVEEFRKALQTMWKRYEPKRVTFPIFMRLGKIS